MTTLLQLGTEWDVQTVLVIAGIAVIFFGIAGFLVVPRVGFQPLDPRRGAGLVVFGVALLVLGLVPDWPGDDEQPSDSVVVPTISSEGTSAPDDTTPTGCPLVSGRLRIGEPPPDLTATIDEPTRCQEDVPHDKNVPVRGTYSGDLAGREIWVFGYGEDGHYYPFVLDACEGVPTRASEGQWDTIAWLHKPRKTWDLVVVVTDSQEASRDFNALLERMCAEEDTGPFLELPAGLAEMHAITVSTGG